ncbi:MAG: hypothetical protein H6510_15540 [Acidobacteria bacterium]|nr:hypothetical protein [Acidobacteriota bacterium]
MRLISCCLILACMACGQKSNSDTQTTQTQPKTDTLAQEVAKFAPTEMQVDLSFMKPSERATLSKLAELGPLIDSIYLKQTYAKNPEIRAEIEASQLPNKASVLAMFDLHFGPWDTLKHNEPFYGTTPRPLGAGVYPSDLIKEEFEQWVTDHPDQEAAFRSPYTVIQRTAEGLVAVPYSMAYAGEIEAAAKILEEAAALTENENLKKFLTLRATAFRTDDYQESEMAWMDLNGEIEVAIGPYEVYTDSLFELKTFFEIFLTVRNPEESAKLDRYKSMLPDFEKNLPIPDEHKNFKRGSESPLAVVDQVMGGGDNRPGVQTIAFNLPNDEKVRELKGSKKVMLKNVMHAKYDQILIPIGQRVLAEDQRALLNFDYFFNEVLFHELSHGLGPGTITVDGQETTVSARLQETYSKIEEGKADIMGVYNLLFLMERGDMPAADRDKLLATYFAGLFRSMRFGVHESHGGGAAFQYNYLKEMGAFSYNAESKSYSVNFEKMVEATRSLVNKVCMIQALGDYDAAKAFLAQYAIMPEEVKAITDGFADIPVDIKPIYPKL